jgi:hypothetical protein
MQASRLASVLLIAWSLFLPGFAGAQSSPRGFLEIDVGRSAAVDEQWVEPHAVSLGFSLARRFHARQKSSLFAGLTLGATMTNGSSLTCRGLPTGECAPLFPEFGMVGVLLGADLIADRLRGQLTVAPALFFSPGADSLATTNFGAQVGFGGSFQVHRRLALTANARRALIAGFEPYSGNFSIRSFGVRLQ